MAPSLKKQSRRMATALALSKKIFVERLNMGILSVKPVDGGGDTGHPPVPQPGK